MDKGSGRRWLLDRPMIGQRHLADLARPAAVDCVVMPGPGPGPSERALRFRGAGRRDPPSESLPTNSSCAVVFPFLVFTRTACTSEVPNSERSSCRVDVHVLLLCSFTPYHHMKAPTTRHQLPVRRRRVTPVAPPPCPRARAACLV